VLVSVLGPRPSRSVRLEDSGRCQVDMQVTPLSGAAGLAEAELCSLLRQTLASCLVLAAYPRKVLTLSVHVLADSGGAAAAVLNAAVLALADAGMPMRTLAGAVTLRLQAAAAASSSSSSMGEEAGSVVQLDVSREEAEEATAQALVVCAEAAEAPLAVVSTGALSLAALEGALAVASHAAADVIAFQRGALREKVLRDATVNFQSLLGVAAADLQAAGSSAAVS
jgi:ribonuclease PH